MAEEKKIITPNADVPHLVKNPKTGTFSWDEVI